MEENPDGLAYVTTNGDDDRASDGLRYAQHWQLYVEGEFIADTSVRRTAEVFQRIAGTMNRSTPENTATLT